MIRRLRHAIDLASALLVGAATELSWRTRALRAESTHAVLRGEVARLELELTAAHRIIERDAVGVDIDACADLEDGGEHHRCGACTYNADHGSEAEELRNGIKNLLAMKTHTRDGRTFYVLETPLRDILDRVDARDSLTHLTERDPS